MAKRESTFSRRGLHKLECAGCDAYVYATVASLERHGVPVCACGAPYEPERHELAIVLGLDDAAVVREYRERLSGFLEGQKGHVNKRHNCQDPEAAITAEFETRRRARARSNRLGALLPAPEPMAF